MTMLSVSIELTSKTQEEVLPNCFGLVNKKAQLRKEKRDGHYRPSTNRAYRRQ